MHARDVSQHKARKQNRGFMHARDISRLRILTDNDSKVHPGFIHIQALFTLLNLYIFKHFTMLKSFSMFFSLYAKVRALWATATAIAATDWYTVAVGRGPPAEAVACHESEYTHIQRHLVAKLVHYEGSSPQQCSALPPALTFILSVSDPSSVRL